jgi:hypothetical protein
MNKGWPDLQLKNTSNLLPAIYKSSTCISQITPLIKITQNLFLITMLQIWALVIKGLLDVYLNNWKKKGFKFQT